MRFSKRTNLLLLSFISLAAVTIFAKSWLPSTARLIQESAHTAHPITVDEIVGKQAAPVDKADEAEQNAYYNATMAPEFATHEADLKDAIAVERTILDDLKDSAQMKSFRAGAVAVRQAKAGYIKARRNSGTTAAELCRLAEDYVNAATAAFFTLMDLENLNHYKLNKASKLEALATLRLTQDVAVMHGVPRNEVSQLRAAIAGYESDYRDIDAAYADKEIDYDSVKRQYHIPRNYPLRADIATTEMLRSAVRHLDKSIGLP